MPRHPKIERSANYTYYADLLWCSVPLLALSCYYYGLRPALLAAVAAVTAYLCDGILSPLHARGYQSHEPSSECFAVLLVLLLPASAPYYVVVAGAIVAVFVKEAFGGEGHYPFHPSAAALAVVGISWPDQVFFYPTPGTMLPLWDASSAALSAGMNATLSSGGLPTATYSQNVGIVTTNKVVNRTVFAITGGFLLLAGISPKFAALLTTIPQCVLGGATVTVFSTIAMTGMKLIASQDLTARNTTIVGLSAALGVGISQASEALSQFPEAFTMVFGQSPVVIATIMAVLLNLILPKEK